MLGLNSIDHTLKPAVQDMLKELAIVKLFQVPTMFLTSKWTSAPVKNLVWKSEDFPPDPRNLIPDQPGVYIFVAEVNLFGFPHGSGLFYIGKATSLYQRIGAYMNDTDKDFVKTKRPLVWTMLNLWSGHLRYYFTITADVAAAEALEQEMLTAYMPHFNTHFDGELGAVMKAFQ